MRISLAIAWAIIGLFLMCSAFVDFVKGFQYYREFLTMLNLLDLLEFLLASAIILSAAKMIRDRSRNPIGLKISSWIFILYGTFFFLFGGFDDTGMLGVLVVLLLLVLSIATLIFMKRTKIAETIQY